MKNLKRLAILIGALLMGYDSAGASSYIEYVCTIKHCPDNDFICKRGNKIKTFQVEPNSKVIIDVDARPSPFTVAETQTDTLTGYRSAGQNDNKTEIIEINSKTLSFVHKYSDQKDAAVGTCQYYSPP